jgi:hypothetical protein
MAQRKSVIKSVQPRILEGNHYNYKMRGETYYEFIVEMANGDKGRASAKSTKFRFSEGDEVFYEYAEDPNHGDRLQRFVSTKPKEEHAVQDGAEKKDGPESPEKRYQYPKDPKEAKLIIAQSCLGHAVNWCIAHENGLSTEDMLKIAQHFEKWVYGCEKRNK